MSRQYTIPLRFQVLAISLVGVVAFLLVGGFAAFNQRSIDDARAAQEQALEANLKVTRAGLTFEAARGLGQRFIAERRPELARGEGEAMAQALALLTAAQEAGGDARMAGEIAELRRLVGCTATISRRCGRRWLSWGRRRHLGLRWPWRRRLGGWRNG